MFMVTKLIYYTKYLEEDGRTNRIDDSLKLFTSICSNKLLKNAHLVLLLNKVCSHVSHLLLVREGLITCQTDLLKQKLESGIKVKK